MSTRDSWREEMQSAWLYRVLSEAEPDPRIAGLFRQLGAEASEQALLWAKKCGEPPDRLRFAPSMRARLVAGLARLLGPRRLQPALAALKVRGVSAYRSAAPPGHPMPTDVAEVGRGHKHAGGGNLRAAVFGVNDGLVSNTSLMLGLCGALSTGSSGQPVLLAGVAGLLAGAFSMAAGEFVSVRAQRELYEYQIALEKEELREYPEAEAEELALIYAARGLAMDEARTLAKRLVADPTHALDVLAREELGLNPAELGSPWGAAGFSFAFFAVGAAIPLLPFMWAESLPSVAVQAAALSGTALFATGASMSLFTGRRPWWSGLRMLVIGSLAGLVTYGIGRWLGVLVG